MRVAFIGCLFALVAACRSDYTRCKACFADDPNGFCNDERINQTLGQKKVDDAKCIATVGLCDGVESRALQGVPHPAHQAICKDKPQAFGCTQEWIGRFQIECETQKVGGVLP